MTLLKRAASARKTAFAEHISYSCFGRPVDQHDGGQRHCQMIVPEGDHSVHIPFDNRHAHSCDAKRASVSHVLAQAKGLKRYLTTPCPGGTLLNVFINIFDDADMWLRRPPAWVDRGLPAFLAAADSLSAKAKKSLRDRARNVHAPIMNLKETIVSVPMPGHGELGRPMRACEVVAPGVPLPKANVGTLLSAWQAWAVLGGLGRAGHLVDPLGELQEALRNQPALKVLILMKDSLGTNACLESALALRSRNSINTECDFLLLALSCMGHQSVLGMRPVTDELPGCGVDDDTVWPSLREREIHVSFLGGFEDYR